uniref:Sec-independent protein translocase protein TatC n=1 Tax=Candidatus Kentrum sp. TUN TaxID=2126343 RepID=A0A450ZSY6_9GAMM|nr:MAG: sec-independent protein translocase protein TatC [Candidatus Kentron sp. TUN]VFK53382.1 MAG: sec-independent protein translocase protein TatC [Candidatus Kentron sp. TUN]VFK56883.1 MAG: sec-independent protein translocase protein TatC [Candidatus Kentron sp. TUN]
MPSTDSPQGEMSFLSHLIELRNRLVRSLIAVIVVLLVLIPFANDLYEWLSAPLLRYLPEGTSMIATEVASPFFAPFKLTIVTAIFIAMPFIVYQLWAFVAPGLYKKEKKLAYPLMITSTMLFYLGAAFAYFAVFPLVFGFFTSVTPEGVEVATDISKYLDFVLKLFFAFGLAFEVPVATILLVSGGFTTPQALASKRPYIVVVAFIIGMLLTPPDVISQTLLALPMWILFELGVFFSRIYTVGKEEPPEKSPVPEKYRYSSVTEEDLDRAMGEGLSDALGDVDPRHTEDVEKR